MRVFLFRGTIFSLNWVEIFSIQPIKLIFIQNAYNSYMYFNRICNFYLHFKRNNIYFGMNKYQMNLEKTSSKIVVMLNDICGMD